MTDDQKKLIAALDDKRDALQNQMLAFGEALGEYFAAHADVHNAGVPVHGVSVDSGIPIEDLSIPGIFPLKKVTIR